MFPPTDPEFVVTTLPPTPVFCRVVPIEPLFVTVAIPVFAEKLVTEVPTDPKFVVVAFPSTVCVMMLVVTEPMLIVVALPPFGASVDSELAEP
jgi:hypothetical protein